MRITLLNPAPESHLQIHHTSGLGWLGIGYLAAYLMRDGHQVRILDAKNSCLTSESLRKHVDDFQPQLFGVTAMTHEIHAAAHACSIVKQDRPDIWTIVGGPHATALPGRTLQEFTDIDVAVAGEGEITLTELVTAKAGGASVSELGGVLGIAFRDHGRTICNGARPWIENLDDLPFPAWELFPKIFRPMITSRGCPFGCVFCMRVLGDRVRTRSVDNVLAEFDALEARFGQRTTWFQDEIFGLNRQWADEFLEKLSTRNECKGYTWSWRGNSRANLADPDLYRRMKAAGCYMVGFGVESGDEAILKRIKKNITTKMAVDAIAAAQQAGLTANAFFILGQPGETWRTALKTVHLAARCRANIYVGVMVPYPGTEVWHMAHRGDFGYRLLTEDWRCYDKYFGNALALKGLSHRQLELLQSLTYVWYFLYNRKFGEFWRFVRCFHAEAWAMFKRLFMPAY
jgi:anaerobic magnesium-protoporphyrin IX monomethyl ester cyclase